MILRKLTTKPVWLWERHRPYPIKKRWRDMPALDVRPDSPVRTNILCTADSLDEGAWCAWSWARYTGQQLGVRIVVDGAWDEGFCAALRRVLPKAEVVGIDDLLDRDLAADKTLSAFAAQHPLGRKLLLLLSLQQSEAFVYADNDVLLFSRPDELLQAASFPQPVYNEEAAVPCYSADVVEAAAKRGLLPCDRLNAGLIYCNKGALDTMLAVELLQAKGTGAFSWFDEQTVMAILMRNAGASPLPSDLYVVSSDRQFWWETDVDYSSIRARHFTGTVRHLMYSKGYPALRSNNGKPR